MIVKKYVDEMSEVYFGDALVALKQIEDKSVDLVFADPPYNIGKKFGDFHDIWKNDKEYIEWCCEWLSLCLEKLKPDGSLYLMSSTQSMPYLDIWIRERMNILSRIVWNYDSSGMQAKKYYGSLYEPILFCVMNPKKYTFNYRDIEVEAKTGAIRNLIDYRKEMPTPYSNKKVPGNTWYFPRVRYRMPEYEEHPSQKPEALLERIILASSNYGDVILDPFAGTFTTGSVAKRLGRRSISIEMQQEYVKIGLRRLGITDEFEGEILKKPQKNFKRSIDNMPNLLNSVLEEEIV